MTTAATGLIDCGNWGVSASWTVPADSVSGVYIARLVRDDNGGASQIPFVVRDDAGSSDMLVRTSDATWQAYNKYGGNSLYSCTACPPGNPQTYKGAFSVSYNRPFDGTIPQDGGRSYLFYAEYQMIRFIERNGYDASYTSQADVDANAGLLRNHERDPLQRPRRVLVGPRARQRRGGARRRRQPGVLQRQRGVLEDALAAEQRRRHADASTGRSRPTRTRTSPVPTDPVEWTGTWRDPRFSRRGRRPAGELAHRPAVHRQLRLGGPQGARRSTRTCACGATRRSRTSAPARPGRSLPAGRRSATSGTSTSTTASARAGRSSSRRPR